MNTREITKGGADSVVKIARRSRGSSCKNSGCQDSELATDLQNSDGGEQPQCGVLNENAEKAVTLRAKIYGKYEDVGRGKW